MADLECRLPCGCRFSRDSEVRRDWCPHFDSRCELFAGAHSLKLNARDYLAVAAVGYAIAASRGVGPWAERRTR